MLTMTKGEKYANIQEPVWPDRIRNETCYSAQAEDVV